MVSLTHSGDKGGVRVLVTARASVTLLVVEGGAENYASASDLKSAYRPTHFPSKVPLSELPELDEEALLVDWGGLELVFEGVALWDVDEATWVEET